MTDLAKAHVKGHMRGQHYVRPYERQGGPGAHETAHHPHSEHHRNPVEIR